MWTCLSRSVRDGLLHSGDVTSDARGGLTEEEQLLFILMAMSDEQPNRAGVETEDVASRLGWSPEQVDLRTLRLEQRGLLPDRDSDGQALGDVG